MNLEDSATHVPRVDSLNGLSNLPKVSREEKIHKALSIPKGAKLTQVLEPYPDEKEGTDSETSDGCPAPEKKSLFQVRRTCFREFRAYYKLSFQKMFPSTRRRISKPEMYKYLKQYASKQFGPVI